MRVLITGSEGTLGRRLLSLLRARGDDVFGCDLQHSATEGVYRADVGEYSQLRRVFLRTQPEVVYHLAAEFGRKNGEEFHEQLWRTNAIGTRNVLELCDARDARMIFASSSEVYGEGFGDAPLTEGLTARTPELTNEYAISKFTNELQIVNFVNRTELPVTTLRFFNAYGPGEQYHPYRSVVALFCYRALHGIPWDVYADYHRTFMYVDDFIPTLAEVSLKPERGVYNVGGTDYRSVEELSALVIQETRCDPSLARLLSREDHNVVNKMPDISRAAALWGHDPRTTLEEGVPVTLDWMRREYNVHQ